MLKIWIVYKFRDSPDAMLYFNRLLTPCKTGICQFNNELSNVKFCKQKTFLKMEMFCEAFRICLGQD